ncbi:Wzz/FepE/Etk N-terminal domain-containing protein [Noviherbaspirillum aridicola]|uniref:Polysaccharide chain length determinant N-terminal domain-containing protein n=1 Tax=Noviherbaspirillum aridicola TaxID=2849687 RepID=A0ABQ4Q2E5_9BURK|nr:Wzz/FepE/Etk N-terminal domain-containing protein [Noviherbaspirillum aridicola]GIZ51314.1 hypothetical protein NCCP691_13280 [Noviherbaspirillum aridicola]
MHNQFPDPAARASSLSTDEVHLTQIVRFLKNGWRWIAGTTVLGLALGLALAFMIEPKFVASATLQMALVAKDPVESPGTLAENLKLPGYYSRETIAACGLDGAARPRDALARGLKPSVNKNAPYVTIYYESTDGDEAERCIRKVVEHIRGKQEQLAKSALESYQVQLANSRKRLEELDHLRADLAQKADSALAGSGAAASSTGFLLSALAATNETSKELQTEIFHLERLLGPLYTKQTEATSGIDTQRNGKTLIRLIALIGLTTFGLFFGILSLLLRHVWRKYA